MHAAHKSDKADAWSHNFRKSGEQTLRSLRLSSLKSLCCCLQGRVLDSAVAHKRCRQSWIQRSNQLFGSKYEILLNLQTRASSQHGAERAEDLIEWNVIISPSLSIYMATSGVCWLLLLLCVCTVVVRLHCCAKQAKHCPVFWCLDAAFCKCKHQWSHRYGSMGNLIDVWPEQTWIFKKWLEKKTSADKSPSDPPRAGRLSLLWDFILDKS